MATQLLPVASGAANSADITLAAGEVATICLEQPEAFAAAQVQIKTPSGGYEAIGAPLTANNKAVAIAAPGTYRVARLPGALSAACGVFRG